MTIAIIFVNDNGNYYIETAETSMEHVRESWKVAKMIDNTRVHYSVVKNELMNPTTEDGEVLVVIQEVH